MPRGLWTRPGSGVPLTADRPRTRKQTAARLWRMCRSGMLGCRFSWGAKGGANGHTLLRTSTHVGGQYAQVSRSSTHASGHPRTLRSPMTRGGRGFDSLTAHGNPPGCFELRLRRNVAVRAPGEVRKLSYEAHQETPVQRRSAQRVGRLRRVQGATARSAALLSTCCEVRRHSGSRATSAHADDWRARRSPIKLTAMTGATTTTP